MNVPASELARYADIVFDVAVPVLAGDRVLINGEIEHAPLTRALAEAAYARGARYVDIWYFDPYARRSRVRHAGQDTLGEIPSWLDLRNEELGRECGVLINLCGLATPDLLSGADPVRAGLDRMPRMPSRQRIQLGSLVRWAIVACPTAEWARAVFGEPDEARLWESLRPVLRLDRPDPVAAWHERIAELQARAGVLNGMGLSAVRFEGPGTDLTIGLLPGAHWATARLESARGHVFQANLPTEEVFTTPDHRRVDGTVRSTRPLVLNGSVIRDLELTFAGGVVTEVRAGEGAELVRTHQATDVGAARLGEVALVDGSSPIGRSGITYLETLLDENATCHLAWGAGLPPGVPEPLRGLDAAGLDAAGVNVSTVHIDFMVGGPEVTVTGIGPDGGAIELLRDDEWQV
ncbi:aminopeptidase [Spongiactinospora sp. TRM90649]|uniref:aminopeptidase n=1 Tax=Spongiactinospora sp. TRM90649 TaxID=3031114 RepID=UPI0023F75371|nr:aminopeptidase [Spongiactinospora sp. TRM90649]MDF5756492.1 aminopeptidase [Spongiactinospora sp. TRM90649]